MPPPPPPPHPFPNPFHHGPPHQQMPAQASRHLQDFPSPGAHGPQQPGSHPNIPPHMGPNRPVEINQDGRQNMGPRQSFDGLTDRLDRLNIDSPRKQMDQMDQIDQNVIDVNRLPGTNTDSTVTYEGWTFHRAEPDTPGEQPTWSRAKKKPMLLSQEELSKLIQRKKKGQTVADQYKSLGNYRRAQVDRLIEDRERQDGDTRFDWDCMYIDSKQKNVRRKGFFEVRYETTSMDVIIRKKLRPDASPKVGSPKAAKKGVPAVVDIHSADTPSDDSESDFGSPPLGGNRRAVQTPGTIPFGSNQGPPPLRRDVTIVPDRQMPGMPQNGPPLHQRPSAEMSPHGPNGPMREMPRGGPQIHQGAPDNPGRPIQGMPRNEQPLHQRPSGEMSPHSPDGPMREMREMPPGGPQIYQRGSDRPMQGMPQNEQPLHQRPSGEMNPRVHILNGHDQNRHGQDGPMHQMPRGGPQIHQRGPDMNTHTQPQPPQGQSPHGPQPHQQLQQPMMHPHAQHPPQKFPNPEMRMPHGGPLPQHQQPQQRGPAGMSPHGPDSRMSDMPRSAPQGHPQGPPGMGPPHAPVPPPAASNFQDPNNKRFGPNPPVEVQNDSGQLPQRRGSQRRRAPQDLPQIINDFPKGHQSHKHTSPKVANFTGKSPKDKGVERWLDEESSLDEEDSELFEHEDDSSATEDSYNIDEKVERHIPGRGSLHHSQHSSRSHSRHEPGYRKHRRSGHRYSGSDGQRYRYSRDSVDIVPARTSRALLSSPSRRQSLTGPVRAPPRLMYSDRPERRDPLPTMAGAGFSSPGYIAREPEYVVDDRDLELERDREIDIGYNDYMRNRMQDASDEIRLRRLAAAREAEYRELKEESRRLERLDRLRRSQRENPRYRNGQILGYD